MRTVSEFLQGKTLFVTGATGFLGQSVVEKILWSVPEVRCIYVLIRAQPQLGGRVRQAQERLEKELFQSSCFDRLRGAHGDGLVEFLSERLIAVPGDIGYEDLGLGPEFKSRLQEEIDVLINSAAVVSFDAPLDEALELNVLSAGRIARFARSCSKCVLIHVSTAYVCGAATDSIPETLYHTANEGEAELFPTRKFSDPDRDIDHMREIISKVQKQSHDPQVDRSFKEELIKRFRKSRGRNSRRREKIENLRSRWTRDQLTKEGMSWARERGWNDTYTYTKALGEQQVARFRGDLPTVIIRPSVIESSLSEPSPGWLDGLRMADPLIAAIGKGRLRSLPLDRDVVIDLVPVDMVVNALLSSIPRIAEESGLEIYQVATGSRNPITLGTLYELIYRYFDKNPMLDKAGTPIQVRRIRFPNPSTFRFQHRLRSVPLDTAERTLEKLTAFDVFDATHKFKRRLSLTKAAHEKLYYYGEIYEPYLNLKCSFRVDNTLRLMNSFPQEEQARFYFDVSRLNWRHYIQNIHIPGVKKYILKVEGIGTLELDHELPAKAASISSIYELLKQTAARIPDKVALQIFRDKQWQRYTYSEVLGAANQIGRRLYGLGFRKGDRIVLYSENQPEWGMAYLGAVSIGLVVVPLDSQTWYREVWSVAHFTEARGILASEKCLTRFSPESLERNEEDKDPILLLNVGNAGTPFGIAAYPRSTGVDQPEAAPVPDSLPAPGPDDLASIIFTTGTAVDPKGAMHTHRNFLNNLLGVSRYLPIYESDQLLSVLPLYHALEFSCGFLMPLYGGSTITYLRSLKPRVILETMRETGTTCMLGVPTLYSLIRDDIDRRILGSSKSTLKSNLLATSKQLSKSIERTFGRNPGKQLFARVHHEFGGQIRIFVTGGSSLGEELYEDFKALGMPLSEGYGLTETAPVLTVNPLNRSRKGSAGKPLPGIELRIFQPDEEGIGEIIVRTPSLMTGYYKNPEATKKAIQAGWFHTGDLGWVDEDGYLYITGRKKDVIVTGAGKNVYPSDLEALYQEISGIAEICVLGLRNGLTEDVHAVIVPEAKAPAPADPAERISAIQKDIRSLAKELPSYQRFQHIHFQDTPLPRQDSGSLARATVRRELLQLLGIQGLEGQGPTADTEGRNQDKLALIAELSRLCGLPAAEIKERSHLYLDLGLDSLMAIELLLFIEHRFSLTIPDEKATSLQLVEHLFELVRAGHSTPGATKGSASSPLLRSLLPHSERPLFDRLCLRLSFASLQTFYRLYFRLKPDCVDSLPEGSFIIAANHSSHLDTGAVISALTQVVGSTQAQRLRVLGAKDYFFDSSLKSWIFSTLLNVVPIEREETSLAGLRTARTLLERGDPVLIFPEGTRSRTGELQDFKAGLGLMAWELKTPIVPTYISGAYRALPAGRFLPRPHRLKVTFGSPIRMEEYSAEDPEVPQLDLYHQITGAVRGRIQEMADKSGST